ncbi:MAG: flagellar biosynthetic protein FliR, partial [Cyanobacteria bacterium NC_groundwater_1444_Ag_S-0.65um_54_12]|nr:flagellar biosynthetic protein FliR [Cyanobacteria bacterium NC_groundwater_1444_Ag_S-0.65um_54_12]
IQIPVRLRIGLSLLLALIFLPLELGTGNSQHLTNALDVLLAIFNELLVGIILGFVAMLVFHGIQFAAFMVGLQMGFGMDQVVDPTSGQQLTSLSIFLTLIATVTFLLLDGHHWLLLALAHSLQVVPPGSFILEDRILSKILGATNELFFIVFALMLPILGILLLVELALAIMNRMMPQMNIFVTGFPTKIGVGFLTLILGLPLIVAYFGDLFTRLARQLITFFG